MSRHKMRCIGKPYGQPGQPGQPETSYAKDYKELLPDLDAILFDILLYIDLLTRIMSLSFFYLHIPRVRQHQLEPDRLISCRQKGQDLWSGRIKMSALTKKCHPPKLRVHAVQAVLPCCPTRCGHNLYNSKRLGLPK
ncbi:hypothetical protein PHYBLDRAFT_71122 [Phycomyces blakesleeanus NRRL 1555(-)]|uniref:Uncharacterized protein n=1 Tax=Phycomyces blakesleeanus (strain ATCC 8743b / DSM 1359 / FGSC 10004 / NBRC 33097 / NRRL 1555) TaxID=763407 RepID=A0A162T4Z6_PHYB8|nr:hypothetical protein PHYBLDRAFT_71122 [Phycomyces blakesleeanus NRRL 1555(-)]OAD66292.1 hypothetical protein PHYBLDRAFT_71122 [Phycomyces blakesleeanus NRRL 1555(-)]|eukprot:XP_018284332.1 hypothetical protein PHYBLDRAFT_71122 [Phycomyces blakesleeanus NRRL 1555(-)]